MHDLHFVVTICFFHDSAGLELKPTTCSYSVKSKNIAPIIEMK